MNREMAEIIRNQKPLTLPPTATVQEACKHMHARKVGAILVTNPKGDLVGIFTGRDVVRMMAEDKHAGTTLLREVMTKEPDCLPPRHTAIDALRLMRDGGFRHEDGIRKSMSRLIGRKLLMSRGSGAVRIVCARCYRPLGGKCRMNREMAEIIRNQKPLTLPPTATVQEACKHMHARKVGAILVTNPKGDLVGIFTGRDVVRMMAEDKHAGTTLLREVMTKEPDCLPPRHTAIDALRLMRDGGFRHVPVVREGVVIGIVSRGDFRGLEQDRLDEETGIWERMR